MITEANDLYYLRDQVHKLQQLLNDPHPGLASWQQAYAERVHAIVKFWSDEATERLAVQKSEK